MEKIALITGASRGIGRATARRLAHEGYTVAVNYHVRKDCADSLVAELAAEGLHPDIVMLDPPRKGCDEATLSAVVRMAPRRVVYVSCNPATAARDAAWLEQNGYHAEKVQPVDLFPRTKHCECVLLMSKVQ